MSNELPPPIDQSVSQITALEIEKVLRLPDMTGLLWVHAPNQYASYWTIGYRLPTDPNKPYGQGIFEIYYPKLKSQDVSNPEWFANFVKEFHGKYYDSLKVYLNNVNRKAS